MPSSKRRPLLVLSVYVLLSLAATWPLARQLGSVIPGDSFDGWQNVWNLWWMREILARASRFAVFHAQSCTTPPAPTCAFNHGSFNGLVTLPIQLVFGLLPAYNTAVLSSFVIGGFGAYLLALYALKGFTSKQANHPQSRIPQFRNSAFITPHPSFLLSSSASSPA